LENERLAARIAELEDRLAGESNPEKAASRD
jgi:BMFP domain-containing protein YqiC